MKPAKSGICQNPFFFILNGLSDFKLGDEEAELRPHTQVILEINGDKKGVTLAQKSSTVARTPVSHQFDELLHCHARIADQGTLQSSIKCSVVWDRQGHGCTFFPEDHVLRPARPDVSPSRALKGSSRLPAGNDGKSGHQTSTSTSRVSWGGVTRSSPRASMQPRIASLMFSMASSRVFPWL